MKLSEETYAEMDRLIKEGRLSNKMIAAEVGCSNTTVYWRRRRWDEETGAPKFKEPTYTGGGEW